MNAALGDCRKSDVDAVFASIAESAGIFDDKFTKEEFLSKIHDWDQAVFPAWTECKVAMGYGVVGAPKHVIEEKLVADTESAWGPDEWEAKLKGL